MDSRLFHLNEMAAEANLQDFQHSIERAIELHEGEPGFPVMADYGTDRETLDDYLFDRQAILDMGGSARSRYTVCGFLIILPVIILSAIPESMRPLGEWSLVAAVGLGVLLFLVYLLLQKAVRTARLRQLDKSQPDCARFVAACEAYIDGSNG